MTIHIDQKTLTWLQAYMGAALATLALLAFPAPALAQPIHIVALGASNTYGKGVLPSESYPAQLQALLREKGADVIVDNAGINGDTTRGMLARLGTVPDGTQLVILQPGGNDFRQGLGRERTRNIVEIVDQLEARGIKVIIMENGMLGSVPQDQKQADKLHLTPKGYALLAQHILPQVEMTLGHYQVSEIKN